jgi:hypothetical protein
MARITFPAGLFLPGPYLGPTHPGFHLATEVTRGITHSRLPSALVNSILIPISAPQLFLSFVVWRLGTQTLLDLLFTGSRILSFRTQTPHEVMSLDTSSSSLL